LNNDHDLAFSAHGVAITALGVSGLAFAGIALNRARPKVIVERVPGHPDTFEL
jgi:hypothetical protein